MLSDFVAAPQRGRYARACANISFVAILLVVVSGCREAPSSSALPDGALAEPVESAEPAPDASTTAAGEIPWTDVVAVDSSFAYFCDGPGTLARVPLARGKAEHTAAMVGYVSGMLVESDGKLLLEHAVGGKHELARLDFVSGKLETLSVLPGWGGCFVPSLIANPNGGIYSIACSGSAAKAGDPLSVVVSTIDAKGVHELTTLADERASTAAATNVGLYVATAIKPALWLIPASGEAPKELFSFSDFEGVPKDLVVSDKTATWTDRRNGMLRRSPLETRKEEVLAKKQLEPASLVLHGNVLLWVSSPQPWTHSKFMRKRGNHPNQVLFQRDEMPPLFAVQGKSVYWSRRHVAQVFAMDFESASPEVRTLVAQ